MTKIIAYYACEGCGDDRTHPQDMVGIDQNGLLWCYDCPQEIFHEDDLFKPVLKKFVTSEDRLREAIAEHRTKALEHFPVYFEYDIDLWALVEPAKGDG